jgi:formylmethanofuran dehydrogenase subunit D
LDHLHQSRCHCCQSQDRHHWAQYASGDHPDAYRTTATNRYADIVLPATLWAESDAVMVNSERNLTLLQQSIPAAGQARPDWQLICEVAAHMGFGEHFAYQSSAEVFDEIRRFWNPKTGYDLRGASYERLRRTPLQWPCPPDDDDRHPIRYLNDGVSQELFVDENGHTPRLAFPTPSRRAVFHARPHMDARELPDDDFPGAEHRSAATPMAHDDQDRQGRQAEQARQRPFVEIHPVDAVALDIVGGQPVELTSRRGRAVLPAVVTDQVRPGNCFVPFHWNDEHGEYLTINALTNDAVDPDSLQPEFKVCAVSLRPVKSVDPVVDELDFGQRKPTLTDDEQMYLAAFFSGLAEGVSGVPVPPASGARGAAGQGRAAGVVVGVADRQCRRLRGPARRATRRLPADQHGRHAAGGVGRCPRRAGDH